MKKIILILILIISTISMAKNPEFSQEQLLETMTPYLKNAKTYEKFKEINAKKAKGGELIYTVTSDGVETKNTAKSGDYIVRNTTKAKEMYIIKSSKFEKRYKHLKDEKNGWKAYKSIGKIKAIKVNNNLLNNLKVEKTFYFTAPWGEQMVVKKGDFLVSPLDYSEVYRIANKEFFETYKIKN